MDGWQRHTRIEAARRPGGGARGHAARGGGTRPARLALVAVAATALAACSTAPPDPSGPAPSLAEGASVDAGQTRWTLDLPAALAAPRVVAAAGSVVLAALDPADPARGRLAAADASTGRLGPVVALEGLTGWPAVVAAGVRPLALPVTGTGTRSGTASAPRWSGYAVSAVDPRDGTVLWRRDAALGAAAAGAYLHVVGADGDTVVGEVYGDASGGRRVVALDLRTGAERWRSPEGLAVRYAAVGAGVVAVGYTASAAGPAGAAAGGAADAAPPPDHVRFLSAATGSVLGDVAWEQQRPAAPRPPPTTVVDSGHALVWGPYGVAAVTLQGRVLWRRASAAAPLVAAGLRTVLLQDADLGYRAVDLDTGDARWTLPAADVAAGQYDLRQFHSAFFTGAAGTAAVAVLAGTGEPVLVDAFEDVDPDRWSDGLSGGVYVQQVSPRRLRAVAGSPAPVGVRPADGAPVFLSVTP